GGARVRRAADRFRLEGAPRDARLRHPPPLLRARLPQGRPGLLPLGTPVTHGARHGAHALAVAEDTAKRLFDVAVSAVALALLSPVLLVVALLIPAASPGPAIYRARRVGLGGRTFTMYKFRTMHVNAGGSSVTTGDDPRVF